MLEEPHDALLARLLDLSAADREAYLRRLREELPGLRERLDQIGGALAASASSSAARQPSTPTSDAERVRVMECALQIPAAMSETIGPYKLLQRLGEGGFGVVWMAEQLEPIRRRVALKIIKRGMDTREVIARFEAERQALALMDHPHIARVLDAGATDLGQPYFVMELVRGVPITRYCDEHRVPTAVRLELFIAVCHAVQHAHQKGVIHRDLKPSNIIVTLHDGVAVPKIIDFGIAKATQGRLTDKTLFTQFHAFIGTPAYTSPEQMEMSGLDVDTRSDIYSLGILLYELLAGRPPFDPDELLKSGLEAMRRTIREVDPVRPSHCLRTLDEARRTTVARQRDTDVTKLSVLLRGDLDWIVMHCLEKERTRRYATANDLAEDVRRYLSNEVIAARPPSPGYRLRKLVRRHRLSFAAGAAIGLSLIVSLVLSSLLLLREQAARARETQLRTRAEANADQARSAAAKSEQVARFMTDMLSGVGPSVALGRDTTLLREVLDRTAQRLAGELRDQPEVVADLRDTLGMVYFDLGQYATAETLLRAAVDARRPLLGDDHALLATSLDHLGVVLSSLNQFTEAEVVLREALAIRRKLHGNQHADVAHTLHHLSVVLSRVGKHAESEAIRRDVLELRRKLLGDEHPDVAASIASLGAHEESLAMRRRLLGDAHPDVAESLVGLGDTVLGQQSLAAYREAFVIRRDVLGDSHPQVTATLLRYLSALAFQSPLEEAVPVAREIIASTRQNLGHDSVALAPSLLALATLLHGDAKHAAEARGLIDEARALLKRSRAEGPPLDFETFLAMREFAFGMFVSGQPERGLELCEEMVLTARSAFGAENALAIHALRPLAWTYFFSGRLTEARALFEEAVAGLRRLEGPGHPMSLILLSGVAAANRELGDFARGRRAIEAGLALLPEAAGTDEKTSSAIATVFFELGLILNHEKNFVAAERILREAIRHNERTKPDAIHLRFRPSAEARGGLGLALAGQGRFAEAEALVVAAFLELKTHEATLGGGRRMILHHALERVAQTYLAWGKADKAAEWRAKYPELYAAAPAPLP